MLVKKRYHSANKLEPFTCIQFFDKAIIEQISVEGPSLGY